MKRFLVLLGLLAFISPGNGQTLTGRSNDASAARVPSDDLQSAHQWRGRRHFLFDDENLPLTTGAAPKNCGDDFVRVKRRDGKSEIHRFGRCD